MLSGSKLDSFLTEASLSSAMLYLLICNCLILKTCTYISAIWKLRNAWKYQTLWVIKEKDIILPLFPSLSRSLIFVSRLQTMVLAEGHPSCYPCRSSILRYLGFFSRTSMSWCESKELITKIWDHATSKSICMALSKSSGQTWLLHCASAGLSVNSETDFFLLVHHANPYNWHKAGDGREWEEAEGERLDCLVWWP